MEEIAMRDPVRVSRILNKLNTAWSHYPDMRFGQMFFVIGRPLFTMDPFFVEDDAFEKVLDDWLKAHNLENGWKS